MRRWLFAPLFAVALALCHPPARAAAHPLGNFTVNQYSRLEVGRESIRLRYIVDMAEIPALQERQAIDADGDGQVDGDEQAAYLARQAPALLGGLHLAVGGASAPLRLVDQSLSFPPGQGGLLTLRLSLEAEASLGGEAPLPVTYRDDNFAGRLGWREIVVAPRAGVALRSATVPAQDQSDELRAYPQDLLSSPLDVRAASFTVVPGAGPGVAEPLAVPAQGGGRAEDSFAALIAAPELTPPVVGLALLLALLLGAGHALTPGHGKAIVAAYLIGARGTARHAVFLGLTTTVTHTLGVFVLGLITLFIANYVLPERIYPWLELASGLMVVAIGVTLFRSRLSGLARRAATAHRVAHDHGDEHPGWHDHDHDHGPHSHSHLPPGGDGRSVTWRSLLALGVSGGLLPCPSALVVLLGAIALNRVALGMLLIVAFSVGLASVLTGIGLLLVYARRLFERFPTDGWLIRALPVASAAVVTLAGTAITVGSLAQVGLW